MELYKLTALDTIKLLKSEEISPLDCLKSLQNRITEVDQHINALPTLCFDRAEQKAKNIAGEQEGFFANTFDPLSRIKSVQKGYKVYVISGKGSGV